jgi:hypothetical protein
MRLIGKILRWFARVTYTWWPAFIWKRPSIWAYQRAYIMLGDYDVDDWV